MNRKRLILGISMLALFIVLIVSGFALFKARQSNQAHIDRRFPLQRLSYCSSDQVMPCIVSFSLDPNGDMIVSFLTTGAFYPDFYLKIKQGETKHIYTCQKVSKFATSVYCSGAVLPLGETFQFSILSLKEDVLLAEGSLSIIGLAIGTPVVAVLTPGEVATASLTESALPTPTLVRATPTPPLSYPNTSYPNPSYP